jgi:two-component system, response regulator PdtaR
MTIPRILLVEDESILRMDLREMIEEAGYQVAGEAGDGEKAIELAHKLHPDLIMMDIKMPKMNGIKAAKVITKSLGIPILFLTAYSQKDLVDEVKQSFVTGYLVKPIRETDLIPAIEIALLQAKRVESLEKKLEERKLVERAKGMVMEQYQWSESKAYQWLRGESMQQHLSISALAKRIVEGKGVEVLHE